MATGTTAPMTLGAAIAAVEAAEASLGAADTAQAAAQAKFDAAQSAKQAADSADADAVASLNGALDNLIAAATAAHVTRPMATPTP